MIIQVTSPDELRDLPRHGIEAQKIRALLTAYGTKYDFCRFFNSEEFILCDYGGSFIVCEKTSGSAAELANFFRLSGFSEIFCADGLGESLSSALNRCGRKINLMRNVSAKRDISQISQINTSPALDDVYDILKTAFEIDYETWYTDMSHRIRHNVSAARIYNDSALIVQHNINGEALLSQIATKPASHGRGDAGRLIGAVCAELNGSEVFVLCEDTLTEFYKTLGFEPYMKKSVICR